MKILIIHNLHRKGSASGDDQVFKNEVLLLKEKGHEVITYTVQNDEFDNSNILKKIKYTLGMIWSKKNYKDVQEIIKKEKPDIAHIHTFFPLLSPSVIYACKKNNVKVIATLHDTRFICPCATSLRGTELCNKCGDGKYFRMIRYKCFKNSFFKSLIVAIIFKFHRTKKTFYKMIDKYICLNDNQISLLKKIGYNQKKITKKYNFVDEVKIKQTNNSIIKKLPNKYVVFYGRIGIEKGINELKKTWDVIEDIPLVVMGGGPLADSFEKWASEKDNVYYLGYTKRELCLEIVKKSAFVVFPSIWYEGCSMVEIETMSLGKTIIATDLGFSNEAIKNNYNGLKFSLGNTNEFINCIYELWNNEEKTKKMEKNARKEYENKYTKSKNYTQLMEIYNNVLKGDYDE